MWGGRQITRHLIDLGHRRIAYLGSALGGRASTDRLKGYRAEIRKAGLPLNSTWILSGPDSRPSGGVAGAGQFLKLDPRPTALFCYNDMMALGVLRALKNAGLRVPDDCSVAGFDDVFLAEYSDPPLTTLVQPKHQMGRDAARLLFDLLEAGASAAGAPDRLHVKSVRGQLLVRASTAPPRA